MADEEDEEPDEEGDGQFECTLLAYYIYKYRRKANLFQLFQSSTFVLNEPTLQCGLSAIAELLVL